MHRASGIEGAHVGLAISTSLTAWVNAALLFRRLRADRIYVPGTGWGVFAGKVTLATLAMSAVIYLFHAPIAQWLELGALARGGRLAVLIAAAIAAYFGVLLALGIRPRDLKPRRG